MLKKEIELVVYGADQLCPSCVNLPSSKETFEWLEAAISRKYKNQPFSITYVDIFNPPANQEKQAFAQKVIEEDMFYPIVLLENKVVGEGNPRLKTIFKEMEQFGYGEA
ncbi:YuzD family protein [Mesobacillus harenae]|uniref:YuzD family protein n=1 Tax=Mesobacillus harenae TaxID=2213203 RepID=UPI00157FC28B|nr:YuzD family protein [Mesobacillus harenae]